MREAGDEQPQRVHVQVRAAVQAGRRYPLGKRLEGADQQVPAAERARPNVHRPVNGLALDFLKIAVGRGTARREVLTTPFDKTGRMRSKTSRIWIDDIGRGTAVQLFFVALPTVDSSYVRAPAEQDARGGRLLCDPAKNLNAAQDIADGQHGVELLGTPERAGQRTLEADWTNRRER
jgi:hypothetical protein